MKTTNCRPVGVELFLLPVETRVPLKFGTEVLTSVQCARVKLTVEGADGGKADGWGETPLSVQWVWPSNEPYQDRLEALIEFCHRLARRWAEFNESGTALEVGHAFIESVLPEEQATFNSVRPPEKHLPHLAALVCCSAFDIALHDAFGVLHGCDTYATYGADFANRDLSHFIELAAESGLSYAGRYVADYLNLSPSPRLPAWHLVGGVDPIGRDELTGDEPDDGYPVVLEDWIRTDGLTCLKIKLRGNDPEWDYDRLVKVGEVSLAQNVLALTTDFNCTVQDPSYVTAILDKLKADKPKIWELIRYVEQPFPYDLEANPIDVHPVSERKPLFMDESAHDWRLVRMGRELGWTGVALKTCKTQTGALLSLCWAKSHGMELMVQDLTNPMLAQIPHVRLAAHADTIMGVETNAMQFYPEASAIEAKVHPGLYRRRGGVVDLSTLGTTGFGYRLDAIERPLPGAVAQYGI